MTINTDELQVQVQKIGEQLDLQAEAITKLLELVSTIDGVDDGPIKSYGVRLKRVYGDTTAAPEVETPPVGQVSTDPAPSSPDQ